MNRSIAIFVLGALLMVAPTFAYTEVRNYSWNGTDWVAATVGTSGASPVSITETISGTSVLASGSVISLAAGALLPLNAFVPINSQGFEISIWGDEGVVNNPTNLATGTFSCGWRISSGTSRIWAGAPGTQVLATRNGLVATISIVAW